MMHKSNNYWSSLFVVAVLTVHIASVRPKEATKDTTRPRGVSPQLAPLYQERAEFECLDGKKRVPFEQVNDDYCDCADGSDEPGTSACKNGRFYCANFGFRPQTLPSNRVNDFICDCCDGSDEWDSSTECPNVCDSMGTKAREDAKQMAEVQTAGYAKRRELAKEGGKILAEKKLEAETKQKELDELAQLKKGVEEAKKEAEEMEKEAKDAQEKEWEEAKKERARAEAKQMFAKMDTDGNEKISSDELQHFAASAGNANGNANDLLKDIFKGKSDEGEAEKEEVEQSQNKLLNFDEFLDKFETVKEFVNEIATGGKKKEDEQHHSADDNEEEEEVAEEEIGEAKLAEKSAEETDEGKGEESVQQQQYDQHTRELIERAEQMRKEYNEVADKVSDLESAVRESGSYLNVEFGPDSAWAPLKGQCAELTTTQYVYRLCMFDRTVQKERNGHSEITLGHWGKWAGPEEGNKFEAQLYEHGQTCWNGPERSTFVQFECGEQLQLVDSSEPSKCEYHFLAKSPTACANPDELREEHAEL